MKKIELVNLLIDVLQQFFADLEALGSGSSAVDDDDTGLSKMDGIKMILRTCQERRENRAK